MRHEEREEKRGTPAVASKKMDDGERIKTNSPETCGLECHPLRSIFELLDWEPPTDKSPVVPLKKHVTLDNEGRGKVMLCHDMKGGYLEEDRYDHLFRETDD